MPFMYEPLLPRGKDLRLLRLLPAEFRDDIEVEIIHVPFSPSEDILPGFPLPEYEALSYVWGSPHRSEKVRIRNSKFVQPELQGEAFPGPHWPEESMSQSSLPGLRPKQSSGKQEELLITISLATALRHLRLPLEPRILWADGLCIDQNNLDERSREVSRMRLIFSSARCVIFWLGPAASNSALALETIKFIGQDVLFEADKHRYLIEPDSRLAKLAADPQAIKDMREHWVAIHELVRRTFFQRLWIYQEIHLPTRAVLMVGHAPALKWEVFVAGFQWIFYQSVNPRSAISEVLSYKWLAVVNNTIFKHRSPRWKDLFTRTFNMDCLDPRDRIYALLGLGPAIGVVPDYKQDCDQVYKDFMVRHIRTQPVLDLFPFCMLSQGDDSKAPPSTSWIPSFGSGVSMLFPYSLATGKSRHETIFEEQYSCLKVGGLILDRESLKQGEGSVSCGNTAVPLNATLPLIIEICRRWAPPDLFDAAYIGGGTLMEAFTVSLAAGEVQEMRPSEWGLRPSIEEGIGSVKQFMAKTNELPSSAVTPDISSQIKQGPPAPSTYMRYLERWLPGRKLFTTKQGYMGLGPAAMETGDFIAFALGCPVPLVVRRDTRPKYPDDLSEMQSMPEPQPEFLDSPYYRLVGSCYLHGLMNGEAVFGPLPPRWTHSFVVVGDSPINTFTFTDSITRKERKPQQQDPRLGALPQGWSSRYADEDGSVELDYDFKKDADKEYDQGGNLKVLWFENIETHEVTRFDPRLRGQTLRERGVAIEEICII